MPYEEVEVDLNQTTRNYPSVGDYYQASSVRDDIPITYQNGLSNYSSLKLGDDRIMFKESVLCATFKPEDHVTLTDQQVRNRAKSSRVRCREYVDAVRAVGFDDVERMERVMRDKLRQRSMATSSPFQVRKSFKFFDIEKMGLLDTVGFTNAMEFLGFQFTEVQVLALFARYDTDLSGFIDYMALYARFMEKNDDVPVVWPPTDHLGVKFEQGASKQPDAKVDVTPHSFEAKEVETLQEAEIKRVFNLVDAQKNGFITNEGLEILLMALNIPSTPQEVAKIMTQVDTTGSGKVSFDAIFKWWYNQK